MLSDLRKESPEDAAKGALAVTGSQARLLIAAMPSPPIDPNDHANFARLAFNEIGGIRDVHLTMSEPLRIGGQSGYQTMAEAKDAATGADIRVVQWLRFGGAGFMQMIGVGPADTWTSVLARLRAVRDSVELELSYGARQPPFSDVYSAGDVVVGRPDYGPRLWAAFRYADHRRAQHALADHVAGLYDFDDRCLPEPTGSASSNIA